MSTEMQTASNPRWMTWVGWILSVLPALMLLMSAGFKFAQPAMLAEGLTHLGWPEKVVLALGIVELASTILYLFPRTTMLGAILLTGYLGGATAAHVRIEEGFLTPVGLGILIWLGLFLREPRVRALVPFVR